MVVCKRIPKNKQQTMQMTEGISLQQCCDILLAFIRKYLRRELSKATFEADHNGFTRDTLAFNEMFTAF